MERRKTQTYSDYFWRKRLSASVIEMSPKGRSRMRACVAALLLLVTSTAGAQKEDRNLSIQNRCATASSTIVVAMTAHTDDYTALGKYDRKSTRLHSSHKCASRMPSSA